ncbi:MAG: aminotransferase [Ignavibacteria bacterium RBG_13_36_8]|nr:MAG: aminotransferase [Ignavibacteria bacterium RBG_13_36_8]
MKISHFKLERFFAEYEFKVDYVLCCSDCESMTINELLSLEPGAADRFGRHRLGYTESNGNPSLRGEICDIYKTIKPDQVMVHSGAEEAIFLFMNAALNAGDHAIVHYPCYQSLFEVANSIGCNVAKWEAREENNWAPDIDELKRLIQSNTKVIVINTPHNPTGYLAPHETFQEIIEIARKNGIILFSDEVYRESEYRTEDRLPAACDVYENAVSLGVMSKTYGLAGLRIGWIAAHNKDILNKIATLKDYTTICNSAPSEFLAEVGLRHREMLVKRNKEIIARNLKVLDKFFERYFDKLTWRRPKAGPIAFPHLIGEEAGKFCDDLVKSESVLLLPGTVYGDYKNHFRIGFGRKNLPEAIKRFENFLAQRGQ